jgi:hypothetical protein
MHSAAARFGDITQSSSRQTDATCAYQLRIAAAEKVRSRADEKPAAFSLIGGFFAEVGNPFFP